MFWRIGKYDGLLIRVFINLICLIYEKIVSMSIPAKYTCLSWGMWSCSDDDDETESVVITQTSTDETSEVYATSATFKLATRGWSLLPIR